MRTSHGEDRDPLDRCYSPDNLARAIVGRLVERGFINQDSYLLDAGTGEGVFAEEAAPHVRHVLGVDLDSEAPAFHRPHPENVGYLYADFIQMTSNGQFDLVIGNPPFVLAEAFIRKGLDLAPFVGFLLPNLFLGANERYENGLWQHLDVFDSLVERAGFHGPGVREDIQYRAGGTQHALFVFGRGVYSEYRGRHLPWGGMPKSNRPIKARKSSKGKLSS